MIVLDEQLNHPALIKEIAPGTLGAWQFSLNCARNRKFPMMQLLHYCELPSNQPSLRLTSNTFGE